MPALLQFSGVPSAGRDDDQALDPGVLGRDSWPGLDLVLDRSSADAAQQVADVVRRLATEWPLPAAAPARDTWRALAALGRADLAVGRLVEGHVDALWILHEAGRAPVAAAVYGVWASASGGTGLTASPGPDGGWSVNGTMRYCSGAGFVDRALVVVSAPDGKRLVDLDVRAAQVPGGPLIRDDDSWPAVGMDVTGSVDIAVRDLAVGSADAVGEPGFYLHRPGFAAGGVGVAAVWLGGAAGVLDDLVRALTPEPKPGSEPGSGSELGSGSAGRPSRASAHQLAHLGAMAATVAAADALLAELAGRIDTGDPGVRSLSADDAGAARAAVELAVEEVLHRAPRVSGPTPLCRDAAFAHRLADLAVYVRQHHAEADYEHLGRWLLGSGELLGRRFG